MTEQNMICIVCPIGCKMTVREDMNVITVFNNKCKRGQTYAVKELTAPTRMLTTTVVIRNAFISRIPVRSSQPLPKNLLGKAMEVINKVEVKAPVLAGEILITNILDTGVDIIASRSMKNIL